MPQRNSMSPAPRYTHPVTPASIEGVVNALCSSLSSGTVPFHVDVRPQPNAAANECFPTVENQVSAHGGEAVIGWSIWELPGVFVEAEFHCIWRSPEGECIDLTPKPKPISRILFLPDPARRYEGRQVDNVRRATHRSPTVPLWFSALSAEFELLNRGNRALQHGEIELTKPEQAEYARIRRAINQLGLEVNALYPSVGPYLPCLCGSGLKSRWCHREYVS